MPRDGSGNYALPSGNPVVTGSTISSTTHNNTNSDIASALTASLAKDGQTVPTANLPMGGFKHTNVATASNLTDYARADQVQNGALMWLGSVSGTNTVTATTTPAITSYTAGQSFRMLVAGTNTGAVTLNINGLGAKNVFYQGVALVGYELLVGAVYELVYDGTQFQVTTPIEIAGEVKAFGGATVPTGYLLCAGQAVSRTTYARLFGVIGTTYGTGDGSTTFNVPDLRGRAVFGKDDMNGSAASRVTNGNSGITGTNLGAAGGSELLHGHSHTFTGSPHTHSIASASGGAFVASGSGGAGAAIQVGGATYQTVANTDPTTAGGTVNSAGGGSSQNMPPAIILNYVIRT